MIRSFWLDTPPPVGMIEVWFYMNWRLMMLSAIIKLVRIGRVIASKVWILVCI